MNRSATTAAAGQCAWGIILRVTVALGSLMALGASEPSTTQPAMADARWALQPLRKMAAPADDTHGWARNDIDRFVLAKLGESRLAPNPEASRALLIRRLSYDLIGLPPSPAEVDAFVADPDPRAYEKLVDRLLSSPHYGERWGRHWLDVVRYTESQGYEYDRLREHAWNYRDYVIGSFNSDKPYDRFVREQIAGDVLEPVTSDGIVATSLLVCGPWDEAGNAQSNAIQRQVTREEEMEDMLSVVGQTFMGMTVNCARCHNHKFDPIPQVDYYRLKAVFDGVRFGERPIATPDEMRRREQKIAQMTALIEAAQKQVEALEAIGRRNAIARRATDPNRPLGPEAMARWDFARPTESALPLELHGGASIVNGKLHLDGKDAFAQTPPLTHDVKEKTLEAWVTLPTLDQGGGGLLSIEANDGSTFDAIVYGERQQNRWTAGSNFFARTRDLAAEPEAAPPGQVIQIAIVYSVDNRISMYRNGVAYGESYVPGSPLQTYRAGQSRLLIGKRHTSGANVYLNGDVIRAAIYDRALSPAEVQASFLAGGDSITRDELVSALEPRQRDERTTLIARIDQTRQELAAMPAAPVSYVGVRVQPPPTHRLTRGDVRTPAEVVTPGALSAISEPSADFELGPDAPEAQRRLKLADWIADPRNPLTARVMVNRIWHYHFGQGIVSTPNDFGFNGSRPTHPELLDWLATEFIRQRWSVKAMHRLICTSATYRQSAVPNAAASGIDADDRLLWRYSPRRLESEAVRDAMLSVSGQINLAVGGPSFRPFDFIPFPANIYRVADKIGPDFNRRTVYRMNVNSGRAPLLEVFDCPEPSVKLPARRATTTPLQALALMNDSFVRRQADMFAARVQGEAGDDVTKQVELAYRYAFGRAATLDELSRASGVARAQGMKTVCWAMLNATEFLYVR